MLRRHGNMLWLVVAVMAAILAACASIGHPEGGPRDTKPPRYMGSNPAPGAVNHNKPKIEIMFDENVQIDNPMERVVVSPAQRNPASIITSGKKIIVELRDTLLPNTTYTIDFSDAIRDLNEGNILDGFATDFSTGPTRDSLQISGMVLEARTLEPAQGMIVGVYSNLADSAISTLKLERIAKTNQLGEFTIRNLKPGEYRIYALNDINRDYHWDRTENVAFYDLNITPQWSPGIAADTLIDIHGNDSIVTRHVTNFAPNDVLLAWFNEDYKALYLKDHSRREARKLSMRMSAPADSLPTLKIVNGPNAGRYASEWSLLETRPERDSLEFWITDPMVIAQDSLLIETRYRRTDSLDNITWTTDTLKFFYKPPKEKKDKKKKKKDAEADSIPQIEFLGIKSLTQGTQELDEPFVIELAQPIKPIAPSAVKLSILRDTIWTPLTNTGFIPDSTTSLRHRLTQRWEPGQKYRVEIDSAAVMSIYGQWNKPYKSEFTVKNDEDYANLFFNVTPAGIPIIVELLDGSDKVKDTASVIDGVAAFHFVDPGTYYARAFIDANRNGVWDTGRLLDKVQPEEVYYFPQRINVRKNWDIEQTWDLLETPLDKQKPWDIKKNKPQIKDVLNNKTEDDDEFSEPQTGGNAGRRPGANFKRPGGVRRANNTDHAR